MLGYNIMYDYWGQGYMTEAAKYMLKFAHDELDQQEFMAFYAKDNLASAAVHKKCGFLYEGEGVSEKFDGSRKFDCIFVKLNY